jgi:16S rRNA (uracil1498-N3)-methyltransferase
MHRFHVPALGAAGTPAPLPPEEARHLSQVLRLPVGAAVRVFDGRGREHLATVETVTRSEAVVRVGDRVDPAPEAGVRVEFAQALLKGDKFDAVVRDLTMLGVWRIQPLVTSHVDAQAAGGRKGGRLERWRRIAVSSAKQCGRAVVPEVAEPAGLDALLGSAVAPVLMLVEPSTGVGGDSIPARPAAATLMTGPEGGWSAGEIALAREAGALMIRLGERTLRADAVPVVALAVLLHRWGEL